MQEGDMTKDNDSNTPPAASYPSDCEILEGLLQRAAAKKQSNERGYVWKSCLPRAQRIKLLLLDVDGVLTDGTIIYTHGGDEIKSFHTRDGLGLRLVQEAGVEVGIITARSSGAVERRAQDLALTHVYQGIKDKIRAFEEILQKLAIQPEEVAYMGDDWLDLPVMIRVGFAATVADATPEMKEIAHYVAKKPGGRGAVREVCDLIIEAKGKHKTLLEKYMKR